ncbi:DUF805 domain-containing protein [Ideonella livida]|uniref:DUF805 domain-containing protein n=1 Tax=Ideonella livida TaxID=2707176 RepID=A0A7C9PIY8_9BURK|nr:DUF805 domain-containing protein [Ideonella livida]NDY92968.1 DUF805 domain-containing protein [Ideonella livida]
MDAPMRLVFAGELMPGATPEAVRERLGAWLQLDTPRLDQMFSGRPVVIKRAVPSAEVAAWVNRFAQRGAVLRVQPAHAEAVPASGGAALRTPASAPAPAPVPVPGRVPPTATAMPPAHRPARVESPALRLPPAGRTPIAPLPSLPQVPPPAPARRAPEPDASAPDSSGLSLVPLAPQESVAPLPDPLAVAASAAAAAEAGVPWVVCPQCGTRQRMQAFCQECVTDLARALAAREEERQAEREARQAVASGAARPGHRGGAAPVQDAQEPGLFGRHIDGRLNRKSYLAGGLLSITVLLGGLMLLALAPGAVMLLLNAVLLVLVGVMGLRMTALRLHDVNLSAWWLLLTLVPTVGQIFSFALAIWPGTEGDNDYGPPPADRHGGVLRVCAVVLVAVLLIGSKMALRALERFMRDLPQQSEQSDEAAFADVPPQLAAEIDAYLGKSEAAEAFRQHYLLETGHRAFAVSPQGAYGWSSGRASPAAAVEVAWNHCEQARQPYTAECVLVHVDHAWVNR